MFHLCLEFDLRHNVAFTLDIHNVALGRGLVLGLDRATVCFLIVQAAQFN